MRSSFSLTAFASPGYAGQPIPRGIPSQHLTPQHEVPPPGSYHPASLEMYDPRHPSTPCPPEGIPAGAVLPYPHPLGRSPSPSNQSMDTGEGWITAPLRNQFGAGVSSAYQHNPGVLQAATAQTADV